MASNYLLHALPPVREKRLKPCIAFGGTPCALRERSQRPCVDPGERTFSQGSICLLLPALGTLASLPDTAVLLHGAVGCGSSCHAATANSRSGSNARWGQPKDSLWMSTAMNEIDVISGGERKLANAIVDIDRQHELKAIVVVSGCVPGITGDDIESVISDTQPRVRAKLVPVHCEGFKTKIWATAYDAYYHGFGRHLFDPPENAAAISDEEVARTVNLFNVSSMGRVDELELIRLLERLGLKVNVFPVFSKPDEMYRVTKAALSISTCPTHDDYIIAHLRDKYGIPAVLRHMPIGIESTGEWLREVAAFFGKGAEADAIVSEEEAELRAGLAPLLSTLKDKRVFLSAGEFRALATANLLCELGMNLVAVRPFHHDDFAEVEYAKLERNAGDYALNIANCQPFEEANLIRRLKPDLFLGHLAGNSTASKLGIATHTIYHIGLSYVGYGGAYQVARRLTRQLRNPALHQHFARNLSLPYRRGWYASDPYQYIKNSAAVQADV
ncbi:MAG TPA: nitrogenase component 1 [Polyangiaceae bacterium]|nr:nitrogenase component 1 [Polyangiaceae bacterium]